MDELMLTVWTDVTTPLQPPTLAVIKVVLLHDAA